MKTTGKFFIVKETVSNSMISDYSILEMFDEWDEAVERLQEMVENSKKWSLMPSGEGAYISHKNYTKWLLIKSF